MINLPQNFEAATDREAVSLVASLRETETVALIGTGAGGYRCVVLTGAEEAEAEALPYDAAAETDGFEIVAARHVRARERLVSVL